MNQGEIWLISLDPSIGSEIKKTRPTVIVSGSVQYEIRSGLSKVLSIE